MGSTIRLALDSDAAALADLYRPFVEAAATSFETDTPDEIEMGRRVRDTLVSYPWLVCEVGGRVVAYAYGTRHRVRAAYQWSVDTSIYVQSAYQRRGIGRGLYTSLFGILAAQGYVNAHAGITLPNPGSVALHESMGFQPVGVYRNVGYKLGAWHEVGWWQLVLRSPEPLPDPPLDFRTVENRPGWTALLASGEPHIRAPAA